MSRLTVGANVKSCYFTIKSAEAGLKELALKTTAPENKTIFDEAEQILKEVKIDLQKQVLYLAREEPQY